MRLRDDPRLRFGQFHNIIDLARRDWERSSEMVGTGEKHSAPRR
jgi:hypothetical protein